MKSPVSRGRISHTLTSEVRWAFRALTTRLDDPSLVTRAEVEFAKYVGKTHCVVFPFVRTAIWAALKSLDLEPGSRVLLPPLTIKPILDVVVHLGFEPVFVDIDLDSVCFDETALLRAVELKPAVAVLTYLFGIVPDVENLVHIMRSHGVFVIEDFSQCLNGEYRGRKIGTFGDLSVYSASSVKTFDTFGGGFALTNDQQFASRLRTLEQQLQRPSRILLLKSIIRNITRNLASSRAVFSLFTFWIIQLAANASSASVGRFTGSRSTEPLGTLPRSWFHRYSALQAEVALFELPQVVHRDAKRVKIIEFLKETIGLQSVSEDRSHFRNVYWQFVLRVKDFDRTRRFLAKRNIDCARTSLVLLTGLPKYPGQSLTPNGRLIYETGTYLPCYHQLKEEEVKRIAAAIIELRSLE